MKVNAEFYFKVFGLTEDENGNPGYGYINVSPKTNEGKISQVEEENYAEMHDTFSKIVAEQLRIEHKRVEKITKEEYFEKVGDNE